MKTKTLSTIALAAAKRIAKRAGVPVARVLENYRNAVLSGSFSAVELFIK